jgi:hypothetical protein
VWIISAWTTRIGDDASTLLKWCAPPPCAVVLVIAATVLGCGGPPFARTPRRLQTLITPILMLVLAIVVMTTKDYSSTTNKMFLFLVPAVSVGFCGDPGLHRRLAAR